MGNLGFQELLIIGVVVLVMFGGRKIPEFMRGLGKGIREFNDASLNSRIPFPNPRMNSGILRPPNITKTTTPIINNS